MPTEKRSTTFRLSDEARRLLEQLAKLHGIAQTAVMEMAIRQMAREDIADAPSEDKPSAPKRPATGQKDGSAAPEGKLSAKRKKRGDGTKETN